MVDAGRWQRIQTLFEAALEQPEEKRKAWLASACADDLTLLAEVAAMLAADQADDELSTRIHRSVETELRTGRLETGQQVGAWTIDSLLATGGMGAVYLARRSDKVFEQSVVIKVVALPLSTDLHTRFRRERQMLADLSHPYIARLLDGGTLPGGEPYLVMEYVRGLDIAAWCERKQLGLRTRLKLFGQVCQAVQFAHNSLVVHRDIKPANVLVDESGTPRLLDFGIATLIEAGDGKEERTQADTRLSSDYASPEQRRGEAVTTASDVYSLGALLYRLLVGRQFSASAVAPAPSVSRSCRSLARGERVSLADLDAIVGRALADDPGQRYPTPLALADDLHRLQSLRPTRARPLGRAGRLGLALRRNPVFSATLGGSALLALAFVVSVTWLAIHLDRERDRALAATATAEQMVDFAFSMFEGADPEVGLDETPSARQLLDQGTARIQESLAGQEAVRARLLHRMGKAYQGLGQYDQAHELMVRALAEANPEDEALHWALVVDLGDVERLLGLRAVATERLERVVQQLALRGDFRVQLASAYNNLGILAADQEQFERAEALAHQALAVSLPEDVSARVMQDRYRHNLARAVGRQGRYAEAIELIEEVIASKRQTLGQPHPSIIRSLEVLAGNYRESGNLDQAATVFEELLRQAREIYGEPSTVGGRLYNSLANVHHDRGDYAQAQVAYEQALVFHESRPDANPLIHAFVVNNLASLQEDRGNLAQAESLFRRSLAMRRELADDNNLLVIHARTNLARVLTKLGQLDEAASHLDDIAALLAEHYPDNTLRRLRLSWQYALVALARGQPESALAGIQAVLESLDQDHPDLIDLRASARLDMARIQRRLGALDEGLMLADQAMILLDGMQPPDHPALLRARLLRAELVAGQGDAGAAAAAVQADWPNLVDRFSPDSSEIAVASALIASATSIDAD